MPMVVDNATSIKNGSGSDSSYTGNSALNCQFGLRNVQPTMVILQLNINNGIRDFLCKSRDKKASVVKHNCYSVRQKPIENAIRNEMGSHNCISMIALQEVRKHLIDFDGSPLNPKAICSVFLKNLVLMFMRLLTILLAGIQILASRI